MSNILVYGSNELSNIRHPLEVILREKDSEEIEICPNAESLAEVDLKKITFAIVTAEKDCFVLCEQLFKFIAKSGTKFPVIAFGDDDPKEVKRQLGKQRLHYYCQWQSFDCDKMEKVVQKIEDAAAFALADKAVIIGSSPAIQKVLNLVDIAASDNGVVMIVGETGVGKSLVAAAIHQKSKLSQGPFVEVNCGAIPNELIEAELFGSRRGSYTGSVGHRRGRFEAANHGTIFLDEIGAANHNFQVKLLKVLESGRFYPVGAETPKRSDARIITATNRDLKLALKDKEIRIDLLYRLFGIEINIPPLRERKEDIRSLVDFFLAKEAPDLSVSENAWNLIEEYSWPGNIRELFAVMKFSFLLARYDRQEKILSSHVRFPHFSL